MLGRRRRSAARVVVVVAAEQARTRHGTSGTRSAVMVLAGQGKCESRRRRRGLRHRCRSLLWRRLHRLLRRRLRRIAGAANNILTGSCGFGFIPSDTLSLLVLPLLIGGHLRQFAFHKPFLGVPRVCRTTSLRWWYVLILGTLLRTHPVFVGWATFRLCWLLRSRSLNGGGICSRI